MLIPSMLISADESLRLDDLDELIDVPSGLNGVAVADTTFGAERGDEGFSHYGEFDATGLARTVGFEDVRCLLERRTLPSDTGRDAFRSQLADLRDVPVGLEPLITAVALVGWVTHAVEQAAAGKLIRPAARYVGPPPGRPAALAPV